MSDFFRERDMAEFKATELRRDHDKRYLAIVEGVEKQKEFKMKRKERLKRKHEEMREEPKEEEKQKLVVHDANEGIVYPIE